MSTSARDPRLVAVLGGGQLGLMLGLAGIPLGLRFRFLDPSPEAPAAAVGDLVVGALDEPDALQVTAAGGAVVTYEWEGVPAAGVDLLTADGSMVRPSSRALRVAQDRLVEKTTFRSLGIDVADFAPVDDRAGLETALDAVGIPAVLKTRRGGYDGKGQVVLRERADADAAWATLEPGAPLIAEALVPFDRELSILAVRAADGDTRCWPIVANEHQHGILRTSIAPAPDLPATQCRQAEQYARALLDELDYVGVLALELFDVGGTLLANELAPRVHNSGHWTIEGAPTSQFENHLRAILGWPLGPTTPLVSSVMVNCIGALPDPAAVLAVEGAHLHDYGKAARPGRKVGHVTLTLHGDQELGPKLAELRAVLPSDRG
ncbi:MAG: 5-(carboxyamino)imidazole ribonucleotide synthase [Actinobacteria bacterium]|nr:5-(carboxyamino)imidazole ribonucleotide synthase [Actinomycetota bacterium]